jgi:hypothetical protein
MSTEKDKFKHSTRLHRDEVAIKKQTKIAKSAGVEVTQPHRLSKHHALDCGVPNCPMCGNPRKRHKDTLTTQEKRFYQETDIVNDKHSNGLKNDKEDLL